MNISNVSRMRIQVLLFALLLSCGCACAVEKHQTENQQPEKQRPQQNQTSNTKFKSALIFIPGFYGSALKDAHSQKRIFLTVGEALFGSHALSLYNSELQTPLAPDLVVDGILDSVSVIPGIYKVDVYADFINELKNFAAQNETQVIPFAYDWRTDQVQTVRSLATLIQDLQRQGFTQINLVAHSMGGLIASYYLAYGTQEPEGAQLTWEGAKNIQHLVVMGTPFRGLASVFRNMQRGTSLGGNHKLLPAETVASFPSCYFLLPFDLNIAIDEKAGGIPAPVATLEYWRDHHLGLLRNQLLGDEVKDRRVDFTRKQLERAKKISELLKLDVSKNMLPAPAHLRVLNLVGYGRSTLAHALFLPDKNEFVFDTDSPPSGFDKKRLMADGDGTVLVTSAQLPPLLGLHAQNLFSTLLHERIFTDDHFRAAYQKFLKE